MQQITAAEDIKTSTLLCIAILLVFFSCVIRFYFVQKDAFLLYERHLVECSQFPIKELLTRSAGLAQHPFFVVFLHYWLRWLPDTEVSLKLIPMLFDVVLILSICLSPLVCPLFLSKKTALYTAGIVSLSPMHVIFSRYVSPYTLISLLVFWMNVFFVEILKRYTLMRAVLYIMITYMCMLYSLRGNDDVFYSSCLFLVYV